MNKSRACPIKTYLTVCLNKSHVILRSFHYLGKDYHMSQKTSAKHSLFEQTKSFLLGIWQKYLDIPIMTKITLMLSLCLMGFIVLGFYYGNIISEIKQNLEIINRHQNARFKIYKRLTSHTDAIRNNLNLANTVSTCGEEKLAAVKNIKDHLEQLSHLIIPLLNQESHRNGRHRKNNNDIFYLQEPLDPVLNISVGNAIRNIKKHLTIIEGYYSKNMDQGTGLPKTLLQQTSPIENDLLVIENFASKILESSVSHINSEIKRINEHAVWHIRTGFVIIALVMLALLVLSVTWGRFLVGPLRIMARSLESIHTTPATADGCASIEKIPVIGNDEIGQVAFATNKLLEHIRNICHFRRTIESDETVTDVYRRLGQVFKRQLGLQSFVIFEVIRESDKMVPVYIEPPEIETELVEMGISPSKCRAFRTSGFVTSFQDEGICQVFSWPDALTHACIPMCVGGEVLGIVQFLFPFINNPEREEAFQDAVMKAKLYLMEAMPVIKSKLLAQTLRESATKDPITLLLNRRYMEMHLDGIVARIKRLNSSLGILMCDIDYFKQVNDQYGHDVGDMVLKQFAGIIKAQARESDYAIRFGGEEFLMLLVDCEPGFAEKVAERLRKKVEEFVFHFPQGEFSKTISIGISEFPKDTDSIWEAIKFADVALYEAKRQGRNKVVRFTPDMGRKQNF